MRRSQEPGFLLMELVVAISIFTIGLTAVGGLLSHLVTSHQELQVRTRLLMEMQQLVEVPSVYSDNASNKQGFQLVQLQAHGGIKVRGWIFKEGQ
jgi:Tfp pilus assembly protein PilV